MVVADESIPYLKEYLEPYTDFVSMPGSEISRQTISDADALIIRTRTICNRDLLEGTGVSFIASATIGYDHIDTSWCSRNGIAWANAPGCNAGSVMQYLTAALLNICLCQGREPSELTLGVIGYGHTGTRVADAAKSLGMRLLINDPPLQRRKGAGMFVPLSGLLKESDIVTLHVPLTFSGRDATFHLAGREFLGAMKHGSFLINTSRGGVTDEKEVRRALACGRLKGYVADVWEGEPFADTELIAMSHLATPHIAGYSADGKMNGTRMAIEALANHFSIPLKLPENSIIQHPGDEKIFIEDGYPDITAAVKMAVARTFDIEAESSRFKSSPAGFENIRNNYPLRREFHAYTVEGPDPVTRICRRIGFRTT